ncbi:MAG: cytochrome ubiquinol oxidase subunit I [Bacilli bacterium]
MDSVLFLSRIQFALTVGFHFIFVPLTIGLVILLAVWETKYARTLNPMYRRMSDFWGKLFTINFVLGVVTGITMSVQFGTNWSEYSKYMGDVFGTPLAIEALVAFFLESTFMGVWLFGRDKFSPKLRAFSMWMVALGTNFSALWIITANGFMQNPVGYQIVNGRAEIVDIMALLTNPYAWYMLAHTVVSAYIVGSFFVLGISAFHILKKQNVEFFKKSFKYALVLGTFAATVTPLIGHQYGTFVATKQPAKAAAMEAVWETTDDLGLSLIQIPRESHKENFEFLTIPKMGSFLYTNSFGGTVIGLNDIPEDEHPPVSLVFYSFRLMVGIGMLLIGLTWFSVYLYRKNKLENTTWFLKILPYTIPLPYIAILSGWVVSEVGRQPWTVYGLLRTAESVSPISLSQVVFSIVTILFFYLVLLIADMYLLFKWARKGPEVEENTTNEGGVTHVS